jgi:hypothetical protein
MKVFNKKVEECNDCPCLDHLDMDGSPYCNMLQKDIKNSNIVDKDCPFNKELTKEDILDLSGERYEMLDKFDKISFKFHNCYVLNLYHDTTYHKGNVEIKEAFDVECFPGKVRTLFSGTITSKPHLEFILQSLNII